MKESGMDKLIELLNEYAHTDFVKYEDGCFKEKFMGEEGRWDSDTEVISKEFGFIKWLVENNKINKRKIDTRLVRYVENHYDEEGYRVESSYENYSDTNTLIMLLSISDTPIEDLIDYLR